MRSSLPSILIQVIITLLLPQTAAAQSFEHYEREFISGYTALHLPEFAYDYRSYFNTIPSIADIEAQAVFFNDVKRKLPEMHLSGLDSRQKANLAIIEYEVQFNLERISLEQAWVKNGRKIPLNGLYELQDHKRWYAYFVKKFTTTDISPEQVFEFGKSEVLRVQNELDRIRVQCGFKSPDAFYDFLRNDTFVLTEKSLIVERFKVTDSIVRMHLDAFTGNERVPPVYPMEWAEAGPDTPPGMYLNRENNAYGKDVFLYNFYGHRYNSRAIEWLYMHEAIPGHHLQASLRHTDSLQQLFLYPGNFEGWGCYVEYYGKELGLYNDPYSETGKWEWDLVRSARLVIEAGIHFYGWTKADAFKYWKEHISGQDQIAEREISRITRWPGQALSYKAGAACIFSLQDEWIKNHPGQDARAFRKLYLKAGNIPLLVMKHILI